MEVTKNSETLLAWHIGPGNPETCEVRSIHRRDLVIRLGDTVTATDRIDPCKRGPHASVRAVDALAYGYYPVLSRVELSGGMIAHGDPTDKYVATNRRHLAMADAHRVIPLWTATRVVRPNLQAVTWREIEADEWATLDLVERWASDPNSVSRDELSWDARDARDARAARTAWTAWDAWDAWDAWVVRKSEQAQELEDAFRWLVCELDERPSWIPTSITQGRRMES